MTPIAIRLPILSPDWLLGMHISTVAGECKGLRRGGALLSGQQPPLSHSAPPVPVQQPYRLPMRPVSAVDGLQPHSGLTVLLAHAGPLGPGDLRIKLKRLQSGPALQASAVEISSTGGGKPSSSLPLLAALVAVGAPHQGFQHHPPARPVAEVTVGHVQVGRGVAEFDEDGQISWRGGKLGGSPWVDTLRHKTKTIPLGKTLGRPRP